MMTIVWDIGGHGNVVKITYKNMAETFMWCVYVYYWTLLLDKSACDLRELLETSRLLIFGSTVVQMQHKIIYFLAIFWKEFWFTEIFKVYFGAFILLFWQNSMRRTGQKAMQKERGELDNERISSQDLDAGYLRHCHTICPSSAAYCYFLFICLHFYLAFHYREPLIAMNAITCVKNES